MKFFIDISILNEGMVRVRIVDEYGHIAPIHGQEWITGHTGVVLATLVDQFIVSGTYLREDSLWLPAVVIATGCG